MPPPIQAAPPNVAALMQSQRTQIMAALPKHLNPDRFIRIAMTEMRKNPTLGQCDPYSFLGAVIMSAQLGLEVGSGLGHAFLIPFKNKSRGILEVQLIPGYKGLIDLARRSGHIETISARVVRERDHFTYAYGDDERIEHRQFESKLDPETGEPLEDAGRITHVYAIARLKGGGIQREVMTRGQINRIKERGNANPVWETDFDEMARKTAVRRLCKYLPLSPDLRDALVAEETSYAGDSQENWKLISPEYTPIPYVSPEATTPAAVNAPDIGAAQKEALEEFNAALLAGASAGLERTQIETALAGSIWEIKKLSADEIYSAIDVITDLIAAQKKPKRGRPPNPPKPPAEPEAPAARPGEKAYQAILRLKAAGPSGAVLECLTALEACDLREGDEVELAAGCRQAVAGDLSGLDGLIRSRGGRAPL